MLKANVKIYLKLGICLLFAACTHPVTQVVTPQETKGCKDADALNYTAAATIADATLCKFVTDSVIGTYDVQDTFVSYGSMGPTQTYSLLTIVVTRGAGDKLVFSDLLQCATCSDGIAYTPGVHKFSYASYSDPYTSNQGEGYFAGDTLYYKQWIYSSMSSFTPSRRGRGAKR
jgi:hypothetical protein